jgi:hypothetical protein
MARAIHVNALVRLLAHLTVDSGAVRDAIATSERPRQLLLIVDPDGRQLRVGETADALVAPIHTARDENDIVTTLCERTREVSPDETRSTCDRDFHVMPFGANPSAAQNAPARQVG